MTEKSSRAERGFRSLRLGSWIKALRLPFYPLTFLAYTAGASLVVPVPQLFSQPDFLWGYAAIFFIEVATVFCNEIFDEETDRRNLHHGAFSGGSRTLVEGKLSRRDLGWGALVALGLSVLVLFVMLERLPSSTVPVVIGYLIAVLLGLGYTVPPLKFSHRGLGEVVVAFTHSLLVIQVGVLAMGGQFLDREGLWIGLPLFFAVLPSIILSGIPDRQADAETGKKTLAVRFGERGAIGLALAATVFAALFFLLSARERWSSPPWSLLLAGPVLHGVVLAAVLVRSWWIPMEKRTPRRDGLILLSLAYILWFVLLPLFFPGETAHH